MRSTCTKRPLPNVYYTALSELLKSMLHMNWAPTVSHLHNSNSWCVITISYMPCTHLLSAFLPWFHSGAGRPAALQSCCVFPDSHHRWMPRIVGYSSCNSSDGCEPCMARSLVDSSIMLAHVKSIRKHMHTHTPNDMYHQRNETGCKRQLNPPLGVLTQTESCYL